MKNYLFIFLISISYSTCLAQPDPIRFFPERIDEITKELKKLNRVKDSTTYNALLWERVSKQVALRNSRRAFWETGYTKKSKHIINDLNYLIKQDIKIGEGYRQTTKLNFLQVRGSYHRATTNYRKALLDYFQILENDLDSRFRDATYFDLSITYFKMDSIDLSIFYIDQIMEESANSCRNGSSIVNKKIKILELSQRRAELMLFYKELISNSERLGWTENVNCYTERLKDLEGR